MAIAEVAAVVLMVLFFNLDFDARLLRLAPVIALGALGFSALSTLLASISGRIRAGALLLPLLAVPMFVPALIAGVRASDSALTGAHFGAIAQWLKILIAFDVIFLTVGYLLFEDVVGED
jgi:heme exporter protein B